MAPVPAGPEFARRGVMNLTPPATIPATSAARLLGHTVEYIHKLVRMGVLSGAREGRTISVATDGVRAHLNAREAHAERRRRKLHDDLAHHVKTWSVSRNLPDETR
jgi:hypothetical protein